MPVSHDRTVFLIWTRGKNFHFQWNGHHYQDQIVEEVKKISQNETSFSVLFCFSITKFFLCSCKTIQTILRTQWCHLKLRVLTVELKALLSIAHSGLYGEIKYLTLCFTKYCICFSKFVDWEMGEDERITFNLCIFAKPYRDILLLET